MRKKPTLIVTSSVRLTLVEQELLTLPEHLSSSPIFSGVHVTRSLVLCVIFVYRYFFFCIFLLALCCLSYFDLRILISPLVSSNSSNTFKILVLTYTNETVQPKRLFQFFHCELSVYMQQYFSSTRIQSIHTQSIYIYISLNRYDIQKLAVLSGFP